MNVMNNLSNYNSLSQLLKLTSNAFAAHAALLCRRWRTRAARHLSLLSVVVRFAAERALGALRNLASLNFLAAVWILYTLAFA